jgi:hypothetical protein
VGVLEPLDQLVDDPLVPVVATEVVVTTGGLDLHEAVAVLLADVEQGHVEGAAAEVEDQDRLVLLLVEPVGQGRRGRLVDDAEHVEARDRAGLLGGLALRVVEIGGNGDDGLLDLFAEIRLGRLPHLLQDEGGNLRG